MAPGEYYPALISFARVRAPVHRKRSDLISRYLDSASGWGAKLSPVSPGSLLDQLSPYARVATAVTPFCLAIVARIVWGKSQTMSWLISLSTVWFVVNVLMAPYSAGLRQELQNLITRLW